MSKDTFLTYEIQEQKVQYTIGDIERPGVQKGEIYNLYMGMPGKPGKDGATGPQGPAGQGVPAGGVAGQYLVKSSSTDYDTEWSNNISNPDKLGASRILIRFKDNAQSKTISLQLGPGVNYTGGQTIEWGDGTSFIQESYQYGTYTHTYDDFGEYELVFYGNNANPHNVDIRGLSSSISPYDDVAIARGIVGSGCLYWNIGSLKSEMYRESDLSAWYETFGLGRTLGTFATYTGLTGEIRLPRCQSYKEVIGYAPNLRAVIFPDGRGNSGVNMSLDNPFYQQRDFLVNLYKIVFECPVPPSVSNFALPTTCQIIVPWSADHSVVAAYKAANGWSTYASQIVEADAPINTGLPEGGTQGQILAKTSSTDYDTEWVNAPTSGDVTHDVILKINTSSTQPLTFRGNAETIDWGDGTVTSPATRGTVHQYAEGGDYTITIDGITDWGDSSQSGISRSIFSCDVILEVEINTTSIGDHAFTECRSLTSVKAPNVQELGTRTFYNCSGLTGDINKMIPTWNLTRIKSWCFYETAFTGIFDASHIIFRKENGYPDQFDYAFPHRIYSIKLPELAVSLELKGVDYLESLVIPDGTRVICDIAPGAANSTMNYVRIPGSVQSIRGSLFTQFYALKSIYIEDGAFSDFNDWNLANNTESYNELTSNFDGGASSICRYCNHLEKVRLPEGMKALGKIGNGISITVSSFSNGIFTEFNIPSTVTQIWNICQDCTNLTTLTFPAGLEKIAANSFTGCTSLATLHMKGTTPPALTAECFTNCPLTAIYVPASAVSDYQNHTDWARFSSIIQAEPTT